MSLPEEIVMKTDLELRQDVERELAWDPKVDASNIAVTAKNGVVTLTGQVRYFIDRCEAEGVAKRVFGVTGIADDIEVTLGGTRPNDTDLTERVLHTLSSNVSVPSDMIRPVVRDGWVTLEGKVQWHYQKTAAAEAVRYLQGVKGVTNSITIDNPVEPLEVGKRITEALTRNARIDARQISVRASGHTAILDGSVRSVVERDEAEMAAWSAPGVNLVENHLSVRY
jgi:osmotically-inducible protein OsmY